MPDETLDISAFKHVVVPIGVIIGLGVARLVNSISQYLQHRARVRFSLAHAIWAVLLFLYCVGLWWISWGLRQVDVEIWSYFTLIYLLVGPSLMYLAIALITPDVPDQGSLDLGGIFDRSGRTFFISLGTFVLWLLCLEMLFLREPLVMPKRISQSVMLALMGAGVVFPSRRTARNLGFVVLPIMLLVLATVRAKLV